MNQTKLTFKQFLNEELYMAEAGRVTHNFGSKLNSNKTVELKLSKLNIDNSALTKSLKMGLKKIITYGNSLNTSGSLQDNLPDVVKSKLNVPKYKGVSISPLGEVVLNALIDGKKYEYDEPSYYNELVDYIKPLNKLEDESIDFFNIAFVGVKGQYVNPKATLAEFVADNPTVPPLYLYLVMVSNMAEYS